MKWVWIEFEICRPFSEVYLNSPHSFEIAKIQNKRKSEYEMCLVVAVLDQSWKHVFLVGKWFVGVNENANNDESKNTTARVNKVSYTTVVAKTRVSCWKMVRTWWKWLIEQVRRVCISMIISSPCLKQLTHVPVPARFTPRPSQFQWVSFPYPHYRSAIFSQITW